LEYKGIWKNKDILVLYGKETKKAKRVLLGVEKHCKKEE